MPAAPLPRVVWRGLCFGIVLVNLVGVRGDASEMLRDLKRAGLKLTPQRIAIVQLFAGDETHPTAQDLFERLRPSFPSMSFATVYNTLDTLARTGLAGTVRLPGKRGDAARFDPNTNPHHHAVCDACGTVVDIAEWFETLAKAEKSHAGRFQKALDTLGK